MITKSFLNEDGKVRQYTVGVAQAHASLYDKLVSVGEKLLRYGYGRVPEAGLEGAQKPAPLIIKPQDGATITIKQSTTIEGDYEEVENDDD